MQLTPESLQKFARENSYGIDMKTFGYINGYPGFAFYYDKKTKKYAIGNAKKFTCTEPFCDEILYSELPLETWTANYVVVKVEGKYYLCDNEGNCLWAQANPFIICRNVFVADTEPMKYYVINKNLKKCEFDSFTTDGELDVLTTEAGYNIAYLKSRTTEGYPAYIINSEGARINLASEGEVCQLSFSEIDFWAVGIEKARYIQHTSWREGGSKYYLNKDFNITARLYYSSPIGLIGKNSKMYTYNYSSIFETIVDKFEKYGNTEVVWYKGKTYFYKANGECDVIDAVINNIRFVVDGILYYDSSNVYLRDKDGKLVSTTKLEPKDVYMLEILREISEK